MAEQSPIIIGEGAYGCVHRPSLKCKNKPRISYLNKTSKIMSKSSAMEELKEYKNVKKADPNNNFYLGVPESCDTDDKLRSNVSAALRCKLVNNVPSFMNFLKSSKLIIMGDGGMNVLQYVQTTKTWPLNHASQHKCELFLLDCLRLFHGILQFKKAGIVHHDLKPQNIVYNEAENRVNIIDFGLMEKKKDILKNADQNNYHRGTEMWFNFPWEIEFLQKNKFQKLKQSSSFTNEFDKKKTKMEDPDEHEGKHVLFFITYLLGKTDTSVMQTDYGIDTFRNFLKSYKYFYTEDIADSNYDYKTFAEKCSDTIDSYGLGFTLLYWLNSTAKYLDLMGGRDSLSGELRTCLYQMVSPWVSSRDRIEVSIVKFEQILEKFGLPAKHGMKIVNHTLLPIGASVPEKNEPIKVRLPKRIKIDKQLVEIDPPECPEGKELNPKTKRCVKICKKGFARNDSFKCVKQVTDSSVLRFYEKIKVKQSEKEKKQAIKEEMKQLKLKEKQLQRKRCPNGTRKNPKTGNCEKIHN